MAKLGISTGTTPNDGLGDNLLAGAVKINSNFSEIYNRFGDGTNLTAIGGTWTSTSAGIHTLKNVGIGTTNPRFTLEVGAVGASGTTLFVNGDARVTGIVTIGPASITLNGISNIINVGSGITINGSTGSISATSIVLGGSTLTGAGVTSITAGSGISVNSSTGNVTITATGSGGSSQFVTTSAGIHTLSKVGIGTTNPLVALDIAGAIRQELHTPTMPVGLNDDIGKNWTKIEMGAGLETIYSLVYCGNGIVLAGSGFGTGDGDIYRSTDYGVTFTKIEMGAGLEIIYSLVYCGNGIVLAGSGYITVGNGDIYRSTDYGVTFTKIEMGAGLSRITSLVYCGNGIVLAGSGNGGDIYRSTNYGLTFTIIDMGVASDLAWSLVYCGNGIVLAGSGDDENGVLNRSTDYGLTFTSIEIGAELEAIWSLVYCGNGIVLAGSGTGTGDGDIYRSTDFGLTFTKIEMGAELEAIWSLVYCGNGIVLAGSGSGTGDGDIYRSDVGFSEASTIQNIYHQHLTGNIGIGTTNPTSALTVSGNARFTGVVTATSFADINGSSLNVSGIATISQGRIQANAASNLRFGNVAAGSGSVRNIAIGDQVLVSLSGGGGRNIGIGELSYYDTTTGQYNIGLGIQAGQKVSTGSYNVILGAYDGNSGGLDIRTSSRNIVIADGEGNIRQYINSSGNVGIKTTVVTEALTVAGIVSATSFYGTLNAGQLTGTLPAINGSALIGVVGSGSGIIIEEDGTPVGTAGTINFGSNINVTFASGIATVSGASSVSEATTAYSLAGSPNLNVGVVTAASFVGNLTGTASFATVAGIATYTSEWILGAVGSSDYTFTGPGFTGAESDPVLYLVRGQQYKFTNTMGAHPFRIQSTVNGSTGTQYNDGITNNDVSNGTLTWDVQFDAPGLLYYQCTAHSGMGGKIYIIDAGVGPDISINTTGIITATSFSGSGANLTSLPAGQLTGTLPAIDGSALLNVTAAGTGIVVDDDNVNVGSAVTVNFGTGLDVTFSAGIATITASGGSLQSRTTVSGVTTSIANLGIGNTNITGFKSYALMKVGLSTTGWLRLYTDSTSRTNDASRSVGEDPAPGSGVIAEVVTTGISTTQIISPFVMGGNLDNPADTTIYASIKNLSGSTQSITANLTILQLEA